MSPRSSIALLLSVVGGTLDFASGYLIFQTNPELLSWKVSLFVFGGVIIVTGILGAIVNVRRSELFRVLMVAYGVMMLAIGWFMYSIPIMGGAVLSGVAMFLVGISMIASGSTKGLMRKEMMMGAQPSRKVERDIVILSLVLVGLLGFGLGFAFSQVTGSLMRPTQKAANYQQTVSSMGEVLSLSQFDFRNLTVVKVTVLNDGNASVTISKILFNGDEVTPNSYASCTARGMSSIDVPLTMPIASRAACELSLSVSSATRGTIYPIEIVTTPGIHFQFMVTAGDMG